MIVNAIILGVLAIGILYLIRKLNQSAAKFRVQTEAQFGILAENLGGTTSKSDYHLQRGIWQPPQIVIPTQNQDSNLFTTIHGLKIYIEETHYGSKWSPYTIFEMPLEKNYLGHQSMVLRNLRDKLQAEGLDLYRGSLQIKNQVLFFKMPMLLYNSGLRENFEKIVRFLRRELLILN